jgi:hypothetical protein
MNTPASAARRQTDQDEARRLAVNIAKLAGAFE